MHTHLDFDGDKETDIENFVLAKLVAEISAKTYHHVAGVIDKDDPQLVVSFSAAVKEMPQVTSTLSTLAMSSLFAGIRKFP